MSRRHSFLPWRYLRLTAIAAVSALMLAACQAVPDEAQLAHKPAPTGANWVASWTASPSLPIPEGALPPGIVSPTLEGTVRYTLRISAGGERVRVVINGGLSVEQLAIGGASIARVGEDGIEPDTLRRLTFSGAESYLVESANAPLWSDPVDLSVPDGGVVAITLYLPEPVTLPLADRQLKTEMAPGDQTGAAVLEGATFRPARPLVSAVLADAPQVDRVIVAYGDSITDGNGSLDPLMRGWPDYLAARLRAAGMDNVAIVNQGIGGARLLRDSVGESLIARFDRDVLAVPGVTDVILLAGINDLGLSGLAFRDMEEPFRTLGVEDFIAAYTQLIERARANGLRIYGATLTPDMGTGFPGYATEEKEVIRQAVNAWILASGAFDGVIDFDAVVRDPADPSRLAPDFDAGDHIHPSDAGYRAMSEAIDLDLFR